MKNILFWTLTLILGGPIALALWYLTASLVPISVSLVKTETGISESFQKVSEMRPALDPPKSFDLVKALDQYGVNVFYQEESCMWINGAVSAGYYSGDVTKILCYSPSEKMSEKTVLQHEAIHVVQFEVGVDKVASFVEQSEHCSMELLPIDIAMLKKYDHDEHYQKEVQAYSLHRQEKCVNSLVYTFSF